MLSYNEAFYNLLNGLKQVYDAQEAAAISHEVLNHITRLDKMQRLMQKDNLLSDTQQQDYDRMSAELLTARPLQYVLGHSWFMGKEYKVNEHVLIPRPETEELVKWITDDWKHKQDSISVLDIGTGSGCIPVSLKLALPASTVTSCDVSTGAITIATENAVRLNADVHFFELDFLETAKQSKLGKYHIIVSNPPYIPETEKDTLHENVRAHEPGLALFVPGDDALLFYRAIAIFGKTHLEPGGNIYCELHVDYASATEQLFKDLGYSYTEVRADMHGNLRMLKAAI
jgi:release factor glutamine methyltransferase